MIVVFPAFIVRGRLTVAVLTAEDVGQMEIGISKSGTELPVVAPDSPTIPELVVAPLLSIAAAATAAAAAAAFFFFVFGGEFAFTSGTTFGGGTSPAATAWAFISFCRFNACDLACFRRWSFR